MEIEKELDEIVFKTKAEWQFDPFPNAVIDNFL